MYAAMKPVSIATGDATSVKISSGGMTDMVPAPGRLPTALRCAAARRTRRQIAVVARYQQSGH